MANKYRAHSRVRESNACARKKFYATKTKAREMTLKAGRTKIYKCPYCPGWHISGSLVMGKNSVAV